MNKQKCTDLKYKDTDITKLNIKDFVEDLGKKTVLELRCFIETNNLNLQKELSNYRKQKKDELIKSLGKVLKKLVSKKVEVEEKEVEEEEVEEKEEKVEKDMMTQQELEEMVRRIKEDEKEKEKEVKEAKVPIKKIDKQIKYIELISEDEIKLIKKFYKMSDLNIEKYIPSEEENESLKNILRKIKNYKNDDAFLQKLGNEKVLSLTKDFKKLIKNFENSISPKEELDHKKFLQKFKSVDISVIKKDSNQDLINYLVECVGLLD